VPPFRSAGYPYLLKNQIIESYRMHRLSPEEQANGQAANLQDSLERYFRRVYQGERPKRADLYSTQTARRVLEGALARRLAQELEMLGFKRKGASFLDIGTGVGECIFHLSEDLSLACGVDRDADAIKISAEWRKQSGRKYFPIVASAEYLPFRTASFDIVFCNQTIEHCSAPSKLVGELVRVLKAGGIGILKAPNYAFPFEHHYQLWCLTHMPRKLAHSYLRMRARPPALYDSLTLVTRSWLISEILKYQPSRLWDLVRLRIAHSGLINSPKRRLIAYVINLFRLSRTCAKHWPQVELAFTKAPLSETAGVEERGGF
jgi:ubiquinone/menaquinone biosynthesis C-methylase UbiE